jgi:signal transduction histidine kinase/ligand-binding sensor domain-containing protein/CheY-like chemotaxis protein
MIKPRFLLIIGYLSIASFIICHPVTSQTPGLNFRYLSTREGLTGDDVRSIYQDKEGFMWFGMEGGLDKYDGRNFHRYYDLVRDTMDNLVTSYAGICEDSYRGMWFINDTNGLILLNKDTEKFTYFKNDPHDPRSLSDNKVRFILEDSQKNLWFTTQQGGLNLFNRKDSSFIHFQYNEGNKSGIGSNDLASIIEDQQGIIWISSPVGLLIRLDPGSKVFENIKVDNGSPFYMNNMVIPVILSDSDNNIWYVNQNTLFRYNPADKSISNHKADFTLGTNPLFTFVTSMIETEKNEFLITTYNRGLFNYDATTQRITHYSYNPANPFGIGSDHLSGIYRSRDGVLWISSYDNGISIYSRNSFRFPQLKNLVNSEYLELSTNATYSFCDLPDGRILMGTENKGLYIFNPSAASIEKFLPELENYSIYDLYADENNVIWICTWINGLYAYDWNTKTLKHQTEFQGLHTTNRISNVAKILKDHKKRLWLGTINEGLMKVDFTRQSFQKYNNIPGDSNSLFNNFIFKLFEDSYGNIWVGMSEGIDLYNEKTNSFRHFKLPNEHGRVERSTAVFDIFEDSKGRLWIGTNRNLYLFDSKLQIFKPILHKFKGNYIQVGSILEDKKGLLWLGTNSGVTSFNPIDETFIDYGSTDGIQYLATFPNAGLRSKNGYMYFGTGRGVTIFNPLMIKDDTLKPPVYITDLSINDVPVRLQSKQNIIVRPINYTKVIRLNYKQSTLSFRFAALNYCNPEGNQYAYQLVGYDKDWIQAGNSNRALYANLPPGKYVFKVIGSNSHGHWNTEGQEIIVLIRSPFWGMLWFKILAGLFLVSIILFIYYYRINNLKKNKKLLEGIVNERTRELHTANKALTEQHEKLIQQHEEISSQNELLSEMSQEILKQNSELESHRSNLEKLVVDRTKELEIALRKAEESDRLKSAFLANMSHEIRTPMNAIVGFANLLKDHELDPDEKTEFIEIINANSETLLVLIDDILDLSLIEANQLTIKKDIFGLNEMLDHLFSSYSLMNKKSELKIKLGNELHELNLKLNSDRVRIKQVLANLLNNAYKFTEKGSIELGAQRKEEQIVFYVKDTGIGIDDGEVDSIFDRFRKSHSANNTLYRGTGLGLAISKALANLLGGGLKVETSLGQGSTFYFYLPWSLVTDEEEILRVATAHRDIDKWKDKNILIVEDEQNNYLYAKKLLAKLEVNIHWAENGLEAIRLATSGIHFHLILMDIKMPVMDGFEATKVIKSKNKDQIVVALTAYARPEDRIHFMQAGFDDYLAKPIKPNDFIGVIRRYL